jgi:nitrite reductase/ring-hydroxylating ferredoxin subunit
MPRFVPVADVASLLPGCGRTVHVGGRDYSLWNVDGEFYCLDDLCPHRGASLGAGFLDGNEVVCPLHGWAFDVRSGQCALRPDRPARTYPTRVHNDQVEIAVEDP